MQSQAQTQPVIAIDVATAELHAGITAVLRSWSVLKTAVENEYGGIDSRNKAENLRKHLFEHFDYRKQSKLGISLEDLEDNLDIFMEDEFTIVLEDDSEKQVAQLIFELYEKCKMGDFSLSHRVVHDARLAAEKKVTNHKQTVGENEDSDNDDDMGVNEIGGQSSCHVDEMDEFLFGIPHGHRPKTNNMAPSRQLGEAVAEAEVQVDDDGFMSVQTKRKGNR